MFCPYCGVQNRDGAKFCSECGNALAPRQPVRQFNPAASQPPRVLYPVPPARGAKKNVAALALGITGTSLALLGAIVWLLLAAVAVYEFSASGSGTAWVYIALFLLFGVGGAGVSTAGCIFAYNYTKGKALLSLIGFLCETGCLIAQIMMSVQLGVRGYFFLSVCTMLAVVLLFIETIFSAAKPSDGAENPKRTA